MSLGFIILRHVRDERTGLFWEKSYDCIRKFYIDNPIMIIDDNSNYNFISEKKENSLINTIIIKSEYPKRGELLPYIYYLRNKIADKVVIIHDSVFINSNINLDCDNYKFLWEFSSPLFENKLNSIKMLLLFGDIGLINFFNSKNWRGCFGVMMIISYNFLRMVNKRYNLIKLVYLVNSRIDRCSLERVLAVIFQKYEKNNSILGSIHKYCKWGGKNFKDYEHLPIIKVWTGR
jgi:hypothetical protein